MPIEISTVKPPPKLDEEPAAKSDPRVTRIIEGTILFIALVLGLVLRLGVLESARVVSGSMKPTLAVNDTLLIDHRSSLHGKWKRGDIVLFNAPPQWESDDATFVKRIIGLPGEKLDIMPDDAIYVDGKKLNEKYTSKLRYVQQHMIEVLGPGEYFVMGDNRGNSDDSRDRGPIKDEDIRGRVILRLTPLSSFGKIAPPDY
ncbi:MAG TPA: signal peptidase I [Abditibacteriaceae bacterium]|jgi:signal peptidase I